MADWKFGRRNGGCVVCDREFLEQEPHVSLLLIDELELGRKDICRECFAAIEADGEPESSRVWWRTRHTVKEKKGVQLDLESLHALFDALEHKDDIGWQELRYLLCLILMRKRRIKVLSVKRIEGVEVFIVRKPRTETEQVVQVFDFTPERQEELRGTLTAIFEGADLDELDPNAAVAPGEQAEEGAAEEGSLSEQVSLSEESCNSERGGAAPEGEVAEDDSPSEKDQTGTVGSDPIPA